MSLLKIRPSGGLSGVEPPVPIPNTEVKRPSADDTEGGTPWENMSLPEGLLFFTLNFDIW